MFLLLFVLLIGVHYKILRECKFLILNEKYVLDLFSAKKRSKKTLLSQEKV